MGCGVTWRLLRSQAQPGPTNSLKPEALSASTNFSRACSKRVGSAPGCFASLNITHAWLTTVSASSGLRSAASARTDARGASQGGGWWAVARRTTAR